MECKIHSFRAFNVIVKQLKLNDDYLSLNVELIETECIVKS